MKYILAILFSFAVTASYAQLVSLNKEEVANLGHLLKNDKEANALYAIVKRRADDALAQTPNPIDTVVSEGHLATDPKKIRTIQSLKDIDKIYSLSIAYVMDGNKKYLSKTGEFILAWATTNRPQGNPINDTKFEDLLFAYDLLKNNLPAEDDKMINSWLEQMADAEIKTGQSKTKITSLNNWNSHRLKVIGLIAYILNNDKYKNYIAEELPVQIEKNLLPDGSGFDFRERDALHYHVYTLEPLISLATVLKRATGKDFYHYSSPSGASIEKSIAFLIPFVSGEKMHAEFVNSKVAFDKKRAVNKEAGYEIGAPFKRTAGVNVLVEASYFDPSCMDAVRKAVGTSPVVYPTWQAVVNEVRK